MTRSPLALSALGATVLLIHVLVDAVERHFEWRSPIARARVVARGFERLPDGTLRGIATPDNFHALETLIDFGPYGKFRDYDLRFDVRDAASANVVLHVDFFAAPSYDSAAQERSRLIGVEAVGTRVSLRINAGWVPPQAYLRLLYTGPPGLALGDLHFRPVPILESVVDRVLIWLAVALLLWSGWLAIAQRFHPDAPIRNHAPARHPAWPLVGIYLAAAVGHIAIHLFAPLWRGDEVQYKTLAATLWWLGTDGLIVPRPLEVPLQLPSRLYPYLISPTLAAGGEFYAAIRFVNALLISSVVFPTYAIARRYLPQSGALFIGALSAALPFAHLSAYVATEVLFFPLYVTAAWLTLESVLEPRKLSWPIAAGCAAALAFCARPSGSVVLPAFLACHAWVAVRSGTARELARRPSWLLAPAAFVPVYLGVQWLTGVEALGSPGIYRSALSPGTSLLESLRLNPAGLLDLALGHLTTLSIPFALPLAVVFCDGARRERGALEPLYTVAAIFFAAVFALGLAFTILVSDTDLGGLGRWHSRYYFHAYPLLMLALAARLTASDPGSPRRGPWVALAVALLLGAHVWFMELRPASQSVWFGAVVDNMDVHWYALSTVLRWLLLAASALLTWLWYRADARLRPAAVALAVLWIGVANVGTAAKMGVGSRLAPDPCGKLATSFLELRPGSFAIVGAQPTFKEAATFWTPYLPSFTGSALAASRYLDTPIGADLDFIVTDGSDPSDPRFELRVDAGTCRIYARRP